MTEHRIKTIDVSKYIILCFAVVVLSMAAKSFLSLLFRDTDLCEYLCPAVLGKNVSYSPPFLLKKIFLFQAWLGKHAQAGINILWNDQWHIFSNLIVAPVIEETMYRGPLFFLRKHIHIILWWVLAILLTMIFALSHYRSGLELLPLITLGLCSCWLIMTTRKFWPCLLLHFLYNFNILSLKIYQSVLCGD